MLARFQPARHLRGGNMISQIAQKASLAMALAAVTVLVPVLGTTDAEARSCENRKGVLGVSRVVEVDTASGPLFGNMQYRDIDFLEPGEVVLTFDDGPLRPHTTKVLNALEKHCTKATFFMVGRMAVTDPDMVQEIERRGHTVGTHTWSHKNLGRKSRSGAIREIELGVSAVSAALGKPAAPFFRFPYLSDPKSMIKYSQGRDMSVFSIDIDSVDFRTRNGNTVVNRILSGLKSQGKGILLFHDIQRSTAKGLSTLLDKLHARGFKVVHMVSKNRVRTLPEFDKQAEKELNRKKKYASRRPLASRSIVWPVSKGTDLPDTEPLVNRKPATPKKVEKVIKSDVLVPEPKPAGERVTSAPDIRPTTVNSAPAPAPANHETASDWRDGVFSHE